MCGLLGAIGVDSEKISYFSNAIGDARVLEHRGPDSYGSFSGINYHLTHRRLSFSGTNPNYPVRSRNGRSVLGLNGEIYNTKKLAKMCGVNDEEMALGGDGYVLCEYLDQFGLQALTNVDGHFAFFMLNTESNELSLARDRFGTRPLYFAIEGTVLYFSSEIKALIDFSDNFTKIDVAALDAYLRTQNFFFDRTIFSNIKTVQAREIVTAKLNGKDLGITRSCYLGIPERSNVLVDHKELTYEVERLMLDGVGSQWQEDMETSIYLSSGIDSNLIAESAHRLNLSFRTSTMKFANDPNDESQFALMRSRHLRVPHIANSLDQDEFWRNLHGISRIVEEPRLGQCVNNLHLLNGISASSRIVMVGIGGDELFAGYPWRYRVPTGFDFPSKRETQELIFSRLHRQFVFDSKISVLKNFDALQSRELIGEVIRQSLDSSMPEREEQFIHANLKLDIMHWLPSILVVEDKIAMSKSVEVRAPFLTNDFWNLAMSLRANCLLSSERDVGKLPLRNLSENWGLSSISWRKKLGFSAPDHMWLSAADKLSSLFNTDNPIWEYLSIDNCRKIVSAEYSEATKIRGFLWSLFYLNDFFTNWEV